MLLPGRRGVNIEVWQFLSKARGRVDRLGSVDSRDVDVGRSQTKTFQT